MNTGACGARVVRPVIGVAILVALTYAGAPCPAAAQAGVPPTEQPAPDTQAVRCDAVLTQDEVAAVAGSGYAGPAIDEPRPGFTRCEWQGDDTNFGFTFASVQTLRNDMQTADEAFEMDVSAVEGDQRKREVLPGIGVKAALVPIEGDAFLVAVARADGVARMVTYKVPRDRAIALARAIAAP